MELRIYILKIKPGRQMGNRIGKVHPAFAKGQTKFINTDSSKKASNTDKEMKGSDQA